MSKTVKENMSNPGVIFNVMIGITLIILGVITINRGLELWAAIVMFAVGVFFLSIPLWIHRWPIDMTSNDK